MPFEGEGMPVCEVFSPAFTVSWSGLIGRSGYHSIFYLGNGRREIYSLKNFNYRDWEFNLVLE